MGSIDGPRRSLRQLFDQRFVGQEPDRFDYPVARQRDSGRAWPPVERDGRGRSPEELLDNLRLSLSNLAARYTIAPRDRDARMGWDAPAGRDASLNSDIIRPMENPHDHDVPGDGNASYEREVPFDEGAGYSHAHDPDGPDYGGADHGAGLWDAIRAARELSDAFPGLAGRYGDTGLFADLGYEEPYRPWFMSGDPSTPWWAADDIS